jgi:hypothetical protein
MAERFAPGATRSLNGLSGRAIIEPQRLQDFAPTLVVASIMASLVPTAIILGLLGARAYFKRAVEAGSAEAAVLLGATYDPAFIEKMGARWIKPDHQEARSWCAKQLGIEDADAKLAELASQWPHNRTHDEGASDPAAQREQPVEVVPGDPTSSGKDEWIGFSTDVNIRKAPSPSAEPLRIAKRGEKLRVIGRQNNWVQVADPATSETGWVCSRFIEPAQSAAQ